MRISFVIIAVMFAISLTFTIVGLITFDLTSYELKKSLGSRNEGFAFNMMQGLDKHIENRITGFQELTTLDIVQNVLIKSNNEFGQISDVESYLILKENETEFSQADSMMIGILDNALTQELSDTMDFYHDEYDYDVIEELFITNAYGANVALASGLSDYSQSDEEWWQITKNTGRYYGSVQFSEDYDSHLIDLAFRINDADGNFIGVLRVLVTLDDLLSDFIEEADVITIPGRSVLLLDKAGNLIYSNGAISLSESSISYFQNIIQEDVGFFEIEDQTDNLRLISYAKSTGYRSFEGFDWVVVIDQTSSSLVTEFIELRQSILIVSILGLIASIIGGLLISSTVSSPLKRLTKVANSISGGNFDISIGKSKIDELNTIGNSFEDMANNLKKLIETEKQLAEAHVKIKNERLSAIGELAASMAHDMKNPLAVITSSAEILQKNVKQNDALGSVVNRMNRAIDRMTHQIDDVLNYVRITPLEIKSIKISELLHLAKNSLEIPENISLYIPDSDIKINCDIRKLEVVFINIFLNSIQSIGKNDGKIECKIEQIGSDAVIQIQDSGPGIPAEIFPKIFDTLVTSKQKGTGLGLSTCKNILEQHHAKISAQNNPTRFIITFPNS